MTATARTPEEAVDFLRGLGTGVMASVVLDGEGRVAASSCEPERAGRMGDLVAELLGQADRAGAPEPVGSLEVSTPGGNVFAVRRPGWSLAVVAERMTLSSLMLFDLHRVLVDLEAASG